MLWGKQNKLVLEEDIKKKSFEATSESGLERQAYILTTEATLGGGDGGHMELVKDKVSQERRQHEQKSKCTKAWYKASAKMCHKWVWQCLNKFPSTLRTIG